MQLFGTYERTYTDYKPDDEPQYVYLDRSARTKFAAARQLMEDWFQRYPQHAQSVLAGNFRAHDDGVHMGAFFELYCFTLLQALYPKVLIEQVVDPKKGNPIDFVVEPSGGQPFCVEATVVGDTELTVKARRQLSTLSERLNTIVANVRLGLDVESASKQDLPHSAIVAGVDHWLGSIDVDAGRARAAAGEFDNVPSHVWEGNGWKLRFEIAPGERVDDIVLWVAEADWMAPTKKYQTRFQGKLEEKADQHPNAQMPFIIAADVLSTESIYRSQDSIAADLFGKEVDLYDINIDEIVATKRSPELPHRSDREKGLWFGRQGPRNQHVSGLLVVNEVVPWSVMTQTPVLWHNPWASRPLSLDAWQGPQWVPDTSTGTMARRPGKSIQDLFGTTA